MASRPPILRYPTLGSTSDEARRLVLAGEVVAPFVVLADEQTNGRGRGSNVWWSDRGGLAFTLAIDPEAESLAARHEPRLALIAALAIIDACRAVVPGLDAGIRWPNDVEVGGRKLAGILPERVETGRGPRILIGVGINLTTDLDAAPPGVRALATSLDEMSGGRLGPDPGAMVLTTFLDAFAGDRRRLAIEDPDLPIGWRSRDLLLGRPVAIRLGESVLRGDGAGIDEDGALLVRSEGRVIRIFGGQVLRTRPE